MDPEKKHGYPPQKSYRKTATTLGGVYFTEDTFFLDHYFARGWVSNKGIKAAGMQIQDSNNRPIHKQTIV